VLPVRLAIYAYIDLAVVVSLWFAAAEVACRPVFGIVLYILRCFFRALFIGDIFQKARQL
jgi:hypothetical protein